MKSTRAISLEESERRFGIILLLPALIFVFAFFAYPVMYSIYLSMTNTNLFLPNFSLKFIGLENFIKLFKDPDFIDSIKISFIFAISSTIIKLIIGFLLALLYQQKIMGFGFFRTIIVIPMMITPICAGLIWKYMMQPGFGLLNYLLGFIGIKNIGWYTEVPTALASVLYVDIWMLTPFVIIVTMSGLSSLPEVVYEAADIDGASWWDKMIRITIPLLKPILIIIVIINLIDGFRVFDNVWIMTKGGPAHATELFTIYAYKEAITKGNLGMGAAASLVIMVIVVIMTVLLFRFIRQEE